MGYPVLLSRRPRRDGRRRAPTVGFAPSAIGAFDAAVNATYRVRASPKAAGVYAEGYVLVCAGFDTLVGVCARVLLCRGWGLGSLCYFC